MYFQSILCSHCLASNNNICENVERWVNRRYWEFLIPTSQSCILIGGVPCLHAIATPSSMTVGPNGVKTLFLNNQFMIVWSRYDKYFVFLNRTIIEQKVICFNIKENLHTFKHITQKVYSVNVVPYSIICQKVYSKLNSSQMFYEKLFSLTYVH